MFFYFFSVLMFFIRFVFVGLKDEIRKVCQEEFLVCGEGDEQGSAWMEKVSLICFYELLYFCMVFQKYMQKIIKCVLIPE